MALIFLLLAPARSMLLSLSKHPRLMLPLRGGGFSEKRENGIADPDPRPLLAQSYSEIYVLTALSPAGFQVGSGNWKP